MNKNTTIVITLNVVAAIMFMTVVLMLAKENASPEGCRLNFDRGVFTISCQVFDGKKDKKVCKLREYLCSDYQITILGKGPPSDVAVHRIGDPSYTGDFFAIDTADLQKARGHVMIDEQRQ